VEEEKKRLEEILRFQGIEEAGAKSKKLFLYKGMLEDKRKWACLVSRGLASQYETVVADSVALAGQLENSTKMEVADFGAGGGLLGLVLAIVCPAWNVTLIEASSRKAAFLAEAAGELNLANVEIENARAESLVGKQEFDMVVSRAAGKLKELAPVAFALLKQGGRYVALKAAQVEDEIAEARAENIRGIEVLKAQYPLSHGVAGRASIVVIKKL